MNYNDITKENFYEYLDYFNSSLFNLNFFLFENENEDNNEIHFEISYEDAEPEIIELFELKKKGLSFQDELKIVFEGLDIRFKKLFKFSFDNNIFFDFCGFKIYENTFENRFKDFEDKFIDVQKIEFIKKEIETILNKSMLNFELFSAENQTILNNAKQKKIHFLSSLLDNYNIKVIKKDDFDFLNFNKYKIEIEKIKQVINEDEPEAIDLSDTKAIDKILYLQKLGIIDFLRRQQPFNTSVNSLASIFSAITGEKTRTLQPMLNPMLSKKVDDTNNPLNSKKAVDRVKFQLINIGFNLNETN